MWKVFKQDYKLQGLLLLIFTFFMMGAIGCQTITPKKQLTMMYGTYNSQYSQYMTATGYMLDDDGTWLKVDDPVLSEDQKQILREKKKILTKMYPLVKVFDSMVMGSVPYSATTEQELLNLIDQLAKLGGVN